MPTPNTTMVHAVGADPCVCPQSEAMPVGADPCVCPQSEVGADPCVCPYGQYLSNKARSPSGKLDPARELLVASFPEGCEKAYLNGIAPTTAEMSHTPG